VTDEASLGMTVRCISDLLLAFSYLICDLLKQALFLQQQIKYENARSKSLMQRTVMPKDASSVTRLKVL
jgi:hypothetical protein